MNKFVSFFKRKDLYLGICRYLLGLYMVPFGVSKILKTQFILIPFTGWQMPLEDLSGIALTWAFLGYSPWFQVLLGVLELVPAMLLLFRRTTLLGAVLMLPMTLNVFLINQAMNLWPGTRRDSAVLLLLNIFVLLFEWKNLKSIVLVLFNKERKLRLTVWEILGNVVLVSVVLYFIVPSLLDYRQQKNELTGDWFNKHPNEWILQSEQIHDSVLPKRLQKSYYGPYGLYEETTESTGKKRHIKYELDKKKQTLQFHDADDGTVKTFHYALLGDSMMKLEARVDSANPFPVMQVFRKRVVNARKY